MHTSLGERLGPHIIRQQIWRKKFGSRSRLHLCVFEPLYRCLCLPIYSILYFSPPKLPVSTSVCQVSTGLWGLESSDIRGRSRRDASLIYNFYNLEILWISNPCKTLGLGETIWYNSGQGRHIGLNIKSFEWILPESQTVNDCRLSVFGNEVQIDELARGKRGN